MYELANTSLPNGLIAGTHGFATVAMTKGLPDALRIRLESLCAYTHKSSSHDASYQTQNPVNWFHAVLPQGDHVLGRVAASDFDYTGRTNRLARLLVFPSREMPTVGAAEVLSAEVSRLSAPWSGEPRHLAEDKAAASRLAAMEPVFAAPTNWTALLGANGAELARRFALLLERNIKSGGRPIYFKTSAAFDQNGTKLLGLFSDLIALLPPELRALATFSTYPAAIPNGTKIHLLGAFEGDRNFAVAASTQPWVDCEKGVVNHADMLPVPVEKPTAAPSREEQGTTLSAVSAAEESAQRKPLRLKQNEPTPQRSQPTGHSSRTYLPPKRNDDKTFALVLSVTAAAIVAVVVGTFFYLQNVAGRKRAEAERIAAEQRAKQEEEERQTILSNAIEEYKSRVDNAVKQLNDIKFRIGTTDNPKHFEEEVLPGALREADAARAKAKSMGADDDQLRPSDNALEEAVAAVKGAINDRKRKLDEERKSAKVDEDSAKQEIAEVAATPKEPTAEEKTEQKDNHPAFCKAEKVEIVGINFISSSDFIKKTEQVIVFYYEDVPQTKLVPVNVEMAGNANMGVRWSEKPKDILTKSKGCFTLWYDERGKTLYWLWDLKEENTMGNWFYRPQNKKEGEFVKENLATKIFGTVAEVYEIFEKHLGHPTYTIRRLETQSGVGGVKLEAEKECRNDTTTAELFRPTDAQAADAKKELEAGRDTAKRNLDEAKKKVDEKKDKIKEIEELYGRLKKSTGEYEDIVKRKNDKKAAKDKERDPKKNANLQRELDDLSEQLNTKRVERNGLAEQICKKLVSDLEIRSADERDFRRDNVNDLDAYYKKGIKPKLEDKKKSSPKDDETCKNAEKALEAAEKALKNFEADFEAMWRGVAEKSSYAITKVVGAKEVEGVR